MAPSQVSTHPYFTAKAEAILRAAGARPGLGGPLAQWAQTQREARRGGGDMNVGVLVGEDGALLAETWHWSATGAGAHYVREALTPTAGGVVGSEVGIACRDLRQATGTGVIHVRYWQVATGAATSTATS